MVSKIDELIAATQSTDWWMFGITLANVIVMATLTCLIARSQNKMQKAQHDIQKYQLLIERNQLKIEKRRFLKDSYTYMLDLKNHTQSFCYAIYEKMFDIIFEQEEGLMLEGISHMQDMIRKSEKLLTEVRANLLTIDNMDLNLKEIDKLYNDMEISIKMLRGVVVCAYVKPEIIDKSGPDKKDALKYILIAFNSITNNSMSGKSISDITGEEFSKMTKIIRMHLMKKYEKDFSTSTPDSEFIQIAYEIGSYFNQPFAIVLKETLTDFDNINKKIFIENKIVETIEKEIKNA